jgi:hypothetical protein
MLQQPSLSNDIEFSDETTESVTSHEEMSPGHNPNKIPFLKRTFGPIKPGAMRGSIFAFLAGSMGLGIFNQPYQAGHMGIINYSLLLLAAAIFSYLGMYLISRLILKY